MAIDPPRVEHLLPPNATPLERALSASDHRLLSAPTWLIRAVWSPDECPEKLLPYLAQAWSVDEWDPAWPEAKKRQVIKDSLWLHQHKGTVGALRRAIAQLDLGATVVEWFEPVTAAAKAVYTGLVPASDARRAYTFRLYVALDAVTDWTAANAVRLRRVAVQTKNVRSLLEAIVLQRPAPAPPMTISAAVTARVHVKFLIEPVRAIRTPNARITVGAATLSTVHARLTPLTA